MFIASINFFFLNFLVFNLTTPLFSNFFIILRKCLLRLKFCFTFFLRNYVIYCFTPVKKSEKTGFGQLSSNNKYKIHLPLGSIFIIYHVIYKMVYKKLSMYKICIKKTLKISLFMCAKFYILNIFY